MPPANPPLLWSLLAAVGWQLVALVAAPEGAPWTWRVALLTAGALAALRVRRRRAGDRLTAWVAVGLLALAVLEWTLSTTDLLARGFLGWLAATLAAGCLVARGQAGTRTTLADRLLLAVTAAALALFCLEAVSLARFGLHTYDPLSSDPSEGPCLFRDEGGAARANPGYRGRWVHREFASVPVEINALGLRDGPDEEAPAAPATRSVVCLGDSFTYGLGVALEDTFQERLEVLIGDPGARVFGAGIPGFGVRDARRQLAELGPHALPDVVVLALFEGNDFQDTHSARERGPLPPPRPPGSVEPPPGPPRLAAFLRELGGALFWKNRCAALQIGSSKGQGLPSQFMKEALLGDRAGRIPPLVRGLFDELELLRGEVTELGAELIVLVVPSAPQAEPERFARWLERTGASAAEASRRGFHDDLVRRLDEAGLRHADTLPLLEAESGAGRSGYHREGHWNARGHGVAARVLAPLIRDALGVD